MKRQTKNYTCGVASVANAAEYLGVPGINQGKLRKLMYADEDDGTDEEEMKRGILALNLAFDEVQSDQPSDAIGWLSQHLYWYGPAIVCLDDESHWVLVIGTSSNRVVVFDPALGAGVKVYTRAGFLTRWRSSTPPRYYALGVSL